MATQQTPGQAQSQCPVEFKPEEFEQEYLHKACEMYPFKEPSSTNIYELTTRSSNSKEFKEHCTQVSCRSRLGNNCNGKDTGASSLSSDSQVQTTLTSNVRRSKGSFAESFCHKMLNEIRVSMENRPPLDDKIIKKRMQIAPNFTEMMKSIARVIVPSSNHIIQEVSQHLVRIIRDAQTSDKHSKVSEECVYILDLSALPYWDLSFLLHLFTDIPPNLSEENILEHLRKYIPRTNVKKFMLRRENEQNCKKSRQGGSFNGSQYTCVSCMKNLYTSCPVVQIKAPRIVINKAECMCQSCTIELAQKDVEDWIQQARQFLHRKDQKAAMACVLMAIHTTKEFPLSNLILIVRELIVQGFQEQALFILSALHEEGNDKDITLYASKAFHQISEKRGKTSKEKWLLSQLAQQASNLIVQSQEDDVPPLSNYPADQEATKHEKSDEYMAKVEDYLKQLKEAWKNSDFKKMLTISSDMMLPKEFHTLNKPAMEGFLDDAQKSEKVESARWYVLRFFQGFAMIKSNNGKSQEGLDSIEKAVWSGHHNEWLSEAAMPIVVSQLTKHPSRKFITVCNAIIKDRSSHCINSEIHGLLESLGITQDDLKPTTITIRWPHKYIKKRKQYEEKMVQENKELDNCNKGYSLINKIPKAKKPVEEVVCFLNASLWFLKDLQAKNEMDKTVINKLKIQTLSCVQHAYVIAQVSLHAGMQFYTARFGLAISAEAIFTAGAYATEEDVEMVIKLLRNVIHNGQFCPFWKMPIVPVCEALTLDTFTRTLHTAFMHELQKNPQNNFLMDAEIQCKLYENNVTSAKEKEEARVRLMQALIESKCLSWSDVSDLMRSELNPRSSEGWLFQLQHLGGDLEFKKLLGFDLNTNVASPIKLNVVKSSPYACGAWGTSGLFSITDVLSMLQVPSEERLPIVFSLDPPDTTHYFTPFQQLRFSPPSLENTDLLYTLFHTCYLLTCFSVGSDVSAKPPFLQRGCCQGLTANLPSDLKEVLTPVAKRGNSTSSISYFWIQADEIECNITQDGANISCQFGEVKMAIRTKPHRPGLDNITNDEDQDSPEAKFAKDLTENYDKISEYFPMFARLRELCKLQLFGAILGYILDNNKGFAAPSSVMNKSNLNSIVKIISSRGIKIARKSCTWVPAAMEQVSEVQKRVCCGGIILAPKCKITDSIRACGDKCVIDLQESIESLSVEYYPSASYIAPVGKCSVPGDILPYFKPILNHLYSDTLMMMEAAMQQVFTSIFPALVKVLTTIDSTNTYGSGGGGGGDISGSSHNKLPSLLLFCRLFQETYDKKQKKYEHDKVKLAMRNRHDKIIGLLLSQGIYDREMEKYESGRHDQIWGATAEAQRQAEENIPSSATLRDERKQEKFKQESKKKRIDTSDKHVAHIVGLDVVRYILIKVDGKTLTDHDINLVKGCCNKVENFELVPARENQSDHKKKDNAFKKAISEYLKEGRVSGSTWAELDLTRVGKAVKILKSDDWPAAISQRVQVLRQICNPKISAQNLWDC